LDWPSSQVIEIDHRSVEVIAAAPEVHSDIIVGAAHPLDRFSEASARFLAEISGAAVICINGPDVLDGTTPSVRRETLDISVDLIEAVRVKLDLSPWLFWGMSGGGWLAQLYARKYPEALGGILLESSCASFLRRLSDPDCIMSPLNVAWRHALESIAPGDEHALSEPIGSDDLEWLRVSGLGELCRRRGGGVIAVFPEPIAISQAMRASMAEFCSFDSRPWLSELKTRALVVAGSLDQVAPVAHSRYIHERLRDSRFVAVTGGGHVPSQGKGAQCVQAIQEFVASARG
jgi:pimeloyl-ACP methyl ester carboxylesterase